MTKNCFKWGNCGTLWENADWEWSKCQEIPTCVKWGEASVIWAHANWKWSQCSGSFVPPVPPPTPSGSVQPPGVDATTLIQPWLVEPWNPYRAGEIKKKKTITVICRINGIEHSQKKEAADLNMTVDDISLTPQNASSIDLNFNMYK